VLDLSCEALYMRYVEAGAAGALGGEPSRGSSAATVAPTGMAVVADGDAPVGEPPLAIEMPTRGELLDDLSRRLGDADRLEVHGAEWLAGDFGRDVTARLDAFRARGGKVS